MKRLISGLLAFFIMNSSTFADRPEDCKNSAYKDSTSELRKTARQAIGADTTDCMSSLSAADEEKIHAINVELASIQQLNNHRDAAAYERRVSEIIKKHERTLSPAAVVAIIANKNRLDVERFNTQLRAQPELARAYLNFKQAMETYRKALDRTWGGVRSEKHAKVLEQARTDLFNEMNNSGLEHREIVKIRGALTKTLNDLWAYGSKRAQDVNRQAATGQYVAGVVLSVDLIILGAVTAGATAPMAAAAAAGTGSAVAASVATAATLSASGAASGAGLSMATDLVKMSGHAAIDSKKNAGFFCQLAHQVTTQGPEAIRNALVGAGVGAAAGGILGGIALKSVAAAKVVGNTVAGGFLVKGSVDAAQQVQSVRELDQAAAQAEAVGDVQLAERLRTEEKHKALDAGMEVASSVASAKSLTRNLKKGTATLEKAEAHTQAQKAAEQLNLKDQDVLFDGGYLKVKGRAIDAEAATKEVTRQMERRPGLQKTLNGSTLVHGSNSSSLLAFTEYSGGSGRIQPIGQIEAQGRVPFSGEIVYGRKGGNHDNVSTAWVGRLESAENYLGSGKGWSKTQSIEALNQAKAELEAFPTTGKKNSPGYRALENIVEVETKRLQQFDTLNATEKKFVTEGFPVMYGIRPKPGAKIGFAARSDVDGEILVGGGVSPDEIRVIYVPQTKTNEVKQLLNQRGFRDIQVAPLEEIREAPRQKAGK